MGEKIYFGYLSDEGVVIKDNGDADNACKVELKESCFTGRNCGDDKILGYYGETLIIVDKDNVCFEWKWD